MDQLTARELSRQTAAALDKVERGETIEVTREGVVVARMIPSREKQANAAFWTHHGQWFSKTHLSLPRVQVDPVDEFLNDRHRRTKTR